MTTRSPSAGRPRVARSFAAAVVSALVVTAGVSAPVRAEAPYPTRPIKIVVPVAVGGGTDYTARAIADALTPAFGQPVVVENKPGGSGNIGVQQVAGAAPDGYTLVMPITSFPINPSLQKLPFDTVRDFAPIVLVGRLPLVLVVHPDLPAKDLAGLIALAKAGSRPINYASSGSGTTAHLASELFNRQAGVRMVNVTYKGGGPAVTDLLGGHVQAYFSTIASVAPYIQNGRLRALAVTGEARSAELPDVPTAVEAGLPGFVVTAWFGLFAPAGTPAAIVERLNRETVNVLAQPEIRAKLARHGVEPAGGTPRQLGEFLVAEIDRWGKVIREAGITAQ